MARLRNIAQGWLSFFNRQLTDTFAVIGGTTADSSNSKTKLTVMAGASTIYPVCNNAALGWDATNVSPLTASVGVRAYAGSTPQGGGFVQQLNVAIAAGIALILPAMAVAVAPGNLLHAACSVTAGNGAGWVPGVRPFWAPDQAEGGVGLAVSVGGADFAEVSNVMVYTVGMWVAKTNFRGLVFVGHSVPMGVEDGDGGTPGNGWAAGWMQRGAKLLGRPGMTLARGGATLGSYTSTVNYDGAAIAGDCVIIQCGINNTNAMSGDAAISGVSPTVAWTYTNGGLGYTTSLRDQLKALVAHFKGLGCTVLVATENAAGTGASTRTKDFRKYYNQGVRAEAVSYCGADGVIDVSPYIETALDSGIPIAGATDDIHGNHALMAQAIYDAFKPGGTYESLLTADANELDEILVDPFWGAATAVGTAPTGWATWNNTATAIYRDGTGSLSISGGSTTAQCCISQTGISNNSEIWAVGAPWNASTPSGQGLLVGLYPSAAGGTGGSEVDFSGNRRGYNLRVTSTNAYLYRHNGGETWFGFVGHSTAFSGNEIPSVRIRRTVVSGNQILLTVTIYRNGVQVSQIATPDTATPAGWLNATLYPGVGTIGNTATTHPNGRVWDFVRLSNYNPITVSSVTPSAATIQVKPGDRLGFTATVLQSAPSAGPAVGQDVTAAIAGIAGATVGGLAQTNAEGIATWADGGGIYIPSATAVGSTGTVTLLCGGITATITVQVVATYSSGGGSGSGDGEEYMTISQPTPDEPTPVTSAAYVQLGSSGDKLALQFDGPLIIRSVAAGGAQPTPDKKGRTIGMAGVALNEKSITLNSTDLWAIAANGPVSVWITK